MRILTDENELVHGIMHSAQQQSSNYRLRTIPAHVASYDPRTHRVKCIIPMHVDANTGELQMTGWIPLLSPIASNGWGVQYAPYGGATMEQPNLGEQIWLTLIEAATGAYIAGGMSWNSASAPPFTTLQAGEVAIKDAFGNYIHWSSGGTITINGASTVNVNAPTVNVNAATECSVTTATASVTASSTASVTAPSINLGSSGGALTSLVTSAMASLFNGHTHPTPSGTSSPPNQTMGAGELTNVVKCN